MKITFLHSIKKILPHDQTFPEEISEDIVLRGEIYSFQILFQAETLEEAWNYELGTQCALPLQVRQVQNVPVMISGFLPNDGRQDCAGTGPGMYPDLLKPLTYGTRFRVYPPGTPTLLWVTVTVPDDAAPGAYTAEFSFRRIAEKEASLPVPAGEKHFLLHVGDAQLPPQKLLRLVWFHSDCLAAYYKVPAWSEAHWRIVENFIMNAAHHGINVLYTPLWTPSLDTEVGYERPDCQLLGISCDEAGHYTFDFSRLERFLEMGKRCGMTHFAMSHLFTQWGAEATPKIIVNGEKRFGWHVPADSPEYAAFLRQLLPELLKLLRAHGLAGKCFFSVSDEPKVQQQATYGKAVALVKPLLEDFPTLEALSKLSFYRQHYVDIPVSGINHLDEFKGQVPQLWSYYCCSHEDRVPNRFIAYPGRRTRAIGILAYVYELAGFLQWAFNFYYTQFSHELLDPFADTCAGGGFPAGDTFLVYPGTDGKPWDSIRNELLHMALQDLRLLELAERFVGRAKLLELIGPVSMLEYPQNDEWITGLRRKLLEIVLER